MSARMMMATILNGILACSLLSQELPDVESGELVAHFVAQEEYLELTGVDQVLSWTATNDKTIALMAGGSNDPGNIRFESTALGGLGALIVRDYSGDDRHMRGSLNLSEPLSAATIFWLGKYQPGADGSLGDGSGQYAYSLGRAGSQGSQMDHQIDDGNFELYGGSGTQTGGSIAYLNGYHSVWQTVYYDANPGHQAFVNKHDLNIPPDGGYNVGINEELQLFGWQNSSGVPAGL